MNVIIIVVVVVVVVVMIDCSKGFDMIDHRILLAKLEAYGVTDTSLTWFHSYLSSRQHFVHLDGKDSSCMRVPHGVPQGSIIGPLLFVLYINDLLLHLSCADVSADLYADDSTLIISADISSFDTLRDSLSSSLRDVEDWATSNKLT